jgi:nucleotide-binding universal stress UspA family protein
MASTRELRVLVATDGSRHAQAAVATAAQFPWPGRTRVRAITARDGGGDAAADSARRALSTRWPGAELKIVDRAPVKGILAEAESFRADVIVLGWRGHGAARRLLMGSVSRGVVRGATCAVLVVQTPQRVRKIVVGLDGSPGAQSALAFVGRLEPPPNGHVTLVSTVELMALPSRRLPGAAAISREVKRLNAARTGTARKALTRAAAELKRGGWSTRTRLLHGEPLRELLAAVAAARAQLLVVGAKGTSGVRQLLLGSVAEGALNRSPVAVLVMR